MQRLQLNKHRRDTWTSMKLEQICLMLLLLAVYVAAMGYKHTQLS